LKFIRKALLPAAIAAGFLGFLGAVGTGVPTVSAAAGDVCAIIDEQTGEDVLGGDAASIVVGERAYFTAYFENVLEVSYDGSDWLVDVNLNDRSGDSDITSVSQDGDDVGETTDVNNTDHLNAYKVYGADNICGDDVDDIAGAYLEALIDCVDTDAGGPFGCDDGDYNDSPTNNRITPGNVGIDLADIAEVAAAAHNSGDLCNEVGNAVEDYLIEATVDEEVASDIDSDINALCFAIDEALEGFLTVDVTCYEAGEFTLSFAPEDGSAAGSVRVLCSGDVDTAEIFARPETVEINPSIANVAHAIVWVVLEDNTGEASAPGTSVFWTTDRCAIESSTVDTEAEYEAANTGAAGIFNNFNALNPATAFAVEQSVFATTAPDGGSRQQEETTTFNVVSGPDNVVSTISAVILHCDPIHAPGVTPGDATVTAIVNRGSLDNNLVGDDDDLVVKKTIKVVGPPAANGVTVTAAPSTLACGEKATITVDVKDSIGQPVSDHTWVEAVTNAGGVLAGTGAVAGQQGLVSPVSSTVAETFGGKATFYLLTSTAHVGKYEVVITTGGGGGVTGQLANGGVTTNLLGGLFTTAPISVQVTVECTVPTAAPQQPAPDTHGPQTGQGITPPSTGEAGLATETNSVAGAVAAVVASLVIAGFAVKLVREE